MMIDVSVNVDLESQFPGLHTFDIFVDTSDMASYNGLHTVPNDGEQSVTEMTTLSPNEIVKDYIATRSPEFRKLDELRSRVSPRCTHVIW